MSSRNTKYRTLDVATINKCCQLAESYVRTLERRSRASLLPDPPRKLSKGPWAVWKDPDPSMRYPTEKHCLVISPEYLRLPVAAQRYAGRQDAVRAGYLIGAFCFPELAESLATVANQGGDTPATSHVDHFSIDHDGEMTFDGHEVGEVHYPTLEGRLLAAIGPVHVEAGRRWLKDTYDDYLAESMEELQKDPAAVKIFDFLSELQAKGEDLSELSETLTRAQSAFWDKFRRGDGSVMEEIEEVAHV